VVQAKPTADPGQLERLASKIRQQAKRIDTSVDNLQRSTGSSTWKGHSADLFKKDVHKDQQDAQAAAGQLRSMADAIERGAREVREYRANIAKQQEEESKKASSGARQRGSYCLSRWVFRGNPLRDGFTVARVLFLSPVTGRRPYVGGVGEESNRRVA
jgi:uncharacterized protein YukE